MKLILTLALLAVSITARAEFTYIDVRDAGQVSSFEFDNPATLEQGKIKYSYKIIDYKDWNGVEKKTLNLFESFVPRPDKPLIMYIGKATLILNKPADKINLQSFVDAAQIAAIDPMNVMIDLKKDVVKNAVTYSEPTSNYRNPPAPAHWCDGNNVLCLQSKFYLPDEYAGAFAKKAREAGSPYEDLLSQSELKVLTGPEITNVADLKEMIGNKITSSPIAVAVQTSYWFSHVLGFAKTIIVLQPNPDPKHSNQTIVTEFMAFGIERAAWDKEYNAVIKKIKLSDVMLGKKTAVKQSTGLLSGIPNLTQDFIEGLANIWSK